MIKKNFKKLHKKYSSVETEGDDLDSVDLEVKDEVGRQRDCLRSIASGLRRSVKVNHYKFKKDESERIKENERIIRFVELKICGVTLSMLKTTGGYS